MRGGESAGARCGGGWPSCMLHLGGCQERCDSLEVTLRAGRRPRGCERKRETAPFSATLLDSCCPFLYTPPSRSKPQEAAQRTCQPAALWETAAAAPSLFDPQDGQGQA